MVLPMVMVKSNRFEDTWETLVALTMRNGVEVGCDYRMKTKAVDAIVGLGVKGKWGLPEVAKKTGVNFTHIEKYVEEFTDLNNVHGFEYTYITRLYEQLQYIKENIRIASRRFQAFTWKVPDDLIKAENQPCLSRLQFFKWDNDEWEVHVDFRSHDLFQAWYANMIAIRYMIEKFVTGEEVLKMIVVRSSNLHIYEIDWEYAKRCRIKTGINWVVM